MSNKNITLKKSQIEIKTNVAKIKMSHFVIRVDKKMDLLLFPHSSLSLHVNFDFYSFSLMYKIGLATCSVLISFAMEVFISFFFMLLTCQAQALGLVSFPFSYVSGWGDGWKCILLPFEMIHVIIIIIDFKSK